MQGIYVSCGLALRDVRPSRHNAWRNGSSGGILGLSPTSSLPRNTCFCLREKSGERNTLRNTESRLLYRRASTSYSESKLDCVFPRYRHVLHCQAYFLSRTEFLGLRFLPCILASFTRDSLPSRAVIARESIFELIRKGRKRQASYAVKAGDGEGFGRSNPNVNRIHICPRSPQASIQQFQAVKAPRGLYPPRDVQLAAANQLYCGCGS